jgi:hypothetical protein
MLHPLRFAKAPSCGVSYTLSITRLDFVGPTPDSCSPDAKRTPELEGILFVFIID